MIIRPGDQTGKSGRKKKSWAGCFWWRGVFLFLFQPNCCIENREEKKKEGMSCSRKGNGKTHVRLFKPTGTSSWSWSWSWSPPRSFLGVFVGLSRKKSCLWPRCADFPEASSFHTAGNKLLVERISD